MAAGPKATGAPINATPQPSARTRRLSQHGVEPASGQVAAQEAAKAIASVASMVQSLAVAVPARMGSASSASCDQSRAQPSTVATQAECPPTQAWRGAQKGSAARRG